MSKNRELLVLSKTGHCRQCKAVKDELDKAGVQYRKGFVEDEAADKYLALAKDAGYSSAPIVVMREVDPVTDEATVDRIFGGNNPVLVKEAIAYVS